jgi:cytochrome c-type biogenesis protein CcmE
MKPRSKRLVLISCALASLGIATWLVLSAFKQNLVFFYTPSQVIAGEPGRGAFRLGGLVEAGSLQRLPDGLTVRFIVSDGATQIPVEYKGILPDLFREGRGVVAQGMLAHDGMFHAGEVLAKHDENYMPPEADYALKRGALQKNSKGAPASVTAGGGQEASAP